MTPELLLLERCASDLRAQSAFTDWVRRIVTGVAELQALDAGQIDAIMDPATGSAVLLPKARAALRRSSRIASVARAGAANRLLATLPATEYARLLSGFESVKLTYGDVLHEPGQEMEHVYFPTDCLVSLLTVVEGHRTLEVGLIGREGMIGSRLALGITTSPVRALVQGTGMALRIRSARFLKEFRRSPALQRAVFRFTDTLMIQVIETAACNRFHLVQARLARWLLMTRERLPSREFRLTHEFLADMLGVRRAGVTSAACALQRRKLIRYRRGLITILDQQGLEAACCSCYQHIKLVGLDPAA
jgi:CRP-like cAMP-binding protein